MKKNYVLWFTLWAFFLIGCRNDNFNPKDTNNQQAMKFRVISGSAIPNVIRELHSNTQNLRVSLKKHSVTGKIETVFGTINTNYIIESTTENNDVYYTFPITTGKDDDPAVYNLSLKSDTDAENAKILAYEPTAEWADSGSDDYEKFTGSVKSYSLDGAIESAVAYVNGNCKPEPCPDCPTNPQGPGGGNPGGGGTGGGGTGGGGNPGGGTTGGGTSGGGTSGGGTTGGGTSGGGTSGGGTSGGGTTGGGTSGGGTTGGGTTGGGTSGGGTSGGGTTGGGTSGGGTSGGGTTGGGTSGGGTSGGGTSGGGTSGGGQCEVCDEYDDNGFCTFSHMEACTSNFTAHRAPVPTCSDIDQSGGGVVITTQEDLCTKIKALTNNNATYKSNLEYLKGKTGDSYESGFRTNLPAPNVAFNQLLQNVPGSTTVDMKVFSNTYGIMHSHYDGLYPIFSPGDILFFNQWINYVYNNNQTAGTNSSIPKVENIFFTLVTSNGNYMLKFDPASIPNQLPTYTQEEFNDLNRKQVSDYLDKAKTVANVSGDVTFDMDKLEKEFLKFVKDKMNLTGMKLYKTESDGTNTEIYLENGNRKTKKCP